MLREHLCLSSFPAFRKFKMYMLGLGKSSHVELNIVFQVANAEILYLSWHHLILVFLLEFLSSLWCFYRIDLFHAVEGMCKDSGASKKAKSLFASLPRLIPKKAASFQKQNDVFLKEEGNSSHMHLNMQGQSHELH